MQARESREGEHGCGRFADGDDTHLFQAIENGRVFAIQDETSALSVDGCAYCPAEGSIDVALCERLLEDTAREIFQARRRLLRHFVLP